MDEARAKLRGPDGTVAGRVTFTVEDDHTDVRLRLRQVPTADTALDAFHGFHIHANDVPGNGEGCLADPVKGDFVAPTATGSRVHQVHAHHIGDLPSVLILPDGTAEVRFSTDPLRARRARGPRRRSCTPGRTTSATSRSEPPTTVHAQHAGSRRHARARPATRASASPVA